MDCKWSMVFVLISTLMVSLGMCNHVDLAFKGIFKNSYLQPLEHSFVSDLVGTVTLEISHKDEGDRFIIYYEVNMSPNKTPLQREITNITLTFAAKSGELYDPSAGFQLNLMPPNATLDTTDGQYNLMNGKIELLSSDPLYTRMVNCIPVITDSSNDQQPYVEVFYIPLSDQITSTTTTTSQSTTASTTTTTTSNPTTTSSTGSSTTTSGSTTTTTSNPTTTGSSTTTSHPTTTTTSNPTTTTSSTTTSQSTTTSTTTSNPTTTSSTTTSNPTTTSSSTTTSQSTTASTTTTHHSTTGSTTTTTSSPTTTSSTTTSIPTTTTSIPTTTTSIPTTTTTSGSTTTTTTSNQTPTKSNLVNMNFEGPVSMNEILIARSQLFFVQDNLASDGCNNKFNIYLPTLLVMIAVSLLLI